jgi:hypothetical protein
VEEAAANVTAEEVEVSIGKTKIKFTTAQIGGNIDLAGSPRPFANEVVPQLGGLPGE